MCYAAFNPKDKTFKSVLLISDGEDHDEEAIKVTKNWPAGNYGKYSRYWLAARRANNGS